MNVGKYLRGEDRHVGTARVVNKGDEMSDSDIKAEVPDGYWDRLENKLFGTDNAADLRECLDANSALLVKLIKARNLRDELVEALKETLNLEYRSPSCQIGIVSSCQCHDCIKSRAKAVIDKATGESA
jgi:hypothetical protein